MSEVIPSHNPLDDLLTPGKYPTTAVKPGLTIQEQRGVVLLQVIARNNRVTETADALAKFLGRQRRLDPLEAATHNGLFIGATGPREHWIFSSNRNAAQINANLETILGQSASVFDQSDARIVLRLTGLNVIDALSKGTALDLRSQAFPSPGATHTVIEHIPALIARDREPLYHDVIIARSYAASFVAWLREAAREYGYSVMDYVSNTQGNNRNG